jgi:hypothetical protein
LPIQALVVVSQEEVVLQAPLVQEKEGKQAQEEGVSAYPLEFGSPWHGMQSGAMNADRTGSQMSQAKVAGL